MVSNDSPDTIEQIATDKRTISCPGCDNTAERWPNGQSLPTELAVCGTCGWAQSPELRDTGGAVRTGPHYQARTWYKEHDLNERAEWLHSLYRDYKFDTAAVIDRNADGIGFAVPDPDPLPQATVENHRDGRVFNRELRDLKPVAKRLLQQHLDGEVLLEEFRYGPKGCHTDLVFVEIDSEALARRLSIASRTPLNSDTKRIYGYWSIRAHGPYSRPGFIKNGKYVESSSRQVWNWLANHGWIATNDSGWGTVVPYHQFCTTHAVELKLRDWSTALEQAQRADGEVFDDRKADRDYWGYADYQWVCLDAGKAHAALNEREQFEDAGVGLFSVSEGVAHKHIEAEPTGFDGPTRDRIWLEETVLKRLCEERPDLVDEAAETTTDAMPRQPELGEFTRGDT